MTSLVGTTGVDTATLTTANDVFVGGNTGNDAISLAALISTNYDVRMGGGNDTFTQVSRIVNSTVSLDGLTLANDGNDTFTGAGNNNAFFASDLRGMAGNDTITNLALNNSTINGNTGTDTITITASTSSSVFGGQGADTINTTGGGVGNATLMTINGNKGADTITLNGSTFTGTVFGGQDGDVINANAVTVALATTTGVTINGDLGADTLTGTGGVDTINGGAGADLITGGVGVDNMTGGAGADVFRIVNADAGTTAATADQILDYATGTDSIDNTALAFTLSAGSATTGAASAAITAAGIATFGTTANTLALELAAIDNSLAGVGLVAGEAVVFTSSDTNNYLFVTDGVAGIGAGDYLAEITGATVATAITLTAGNISGIA